MCMSALLSVLFQAGSKAALYKWLSDNSERARLTTLVIIRIQTLLLVYTPPYIANVIRFTHKKNQYNYS